MRPERAERAVWLTGLYNMAFLAVVTVLFVAMAGRLVSVFTADPATSELARASLVIMSYGYVFYAWGMVLTQAFNGAGDTATPTWLNLIGFWMLQIPMASWLSGTAGWGPRGVFWSVAIAESVLAVMAGFVFRRGGWKTRTV
jgi:Na+-driven multidrug efflux pump